jgi:hypothetical protein
MLTTDADPTWLPDRTTVRVDAYLVQRYRILGTPCFVYQAWAPIPGLVFGGPYSTITSDGGDWWGRLGTERLGPDLDALPRGEERVAAVRAWQQANDDRAYAIILRAFPEAAEGRRDMGEITRTLPECPAD